MSSILVIIPARGGSKGISNKNISSLGGKPLLAWTILAAKQVNSIARIVVTTDSPDIAEVAKEYQAEVPFLRPRELALDDTPGMAPLIHAIRWLEEHQNYRPEYVMCLQPTSPLRSARDIETAIEIALEKDADGVVSVAPVKQHPEWMKQVDAEGRLQDYLASEQLAIRRQDLSAIYALNGAIYMARRHIVLEKMTWYTHETYAYVMPTERSIDIDTPWDLHLADMILRDRENDATDRHP